MSEVGGSSGTPDPGDKGPKEPQPATTTRERQRTGPGFRLFAVLFYAAVGLAILWSTDFFQQNVVNTRWGLWAVAGAVVVLCVLVMIPTTRAWFGDATAQTRVGVTIFFVLPVLLLLLGAIVLLQPPFNLMAARVVLITIASLLPATLFYLFIATRKASIANEYLADLERLGLLELTPVRGVGTEDTGSLEREAGRERRVVSYLERFEGVYGRLSQQDSAQLLRGLLSTKSTSPSSQSSSPQAEISSRPTALRADALLQTGTTLPVVGATILIALGWLIALPPWQPFWVQPAPVDPMQADPAALFWSAVWPEPLLAANQRQVDNSELWRALLPAQSPVLFAFLGAYFFSLQMLFRRFVRRDLRPNAYIAVALRILLAVIGIWVVVPALRVLDPQVSPDLLLVIGFVVGVFPRVIWQFLSQLVSKISYASIVLPTLRSRLPLSDLDGLTVWHEARLEEEDVENVPNMATADIVELILNTQIPTNRIVDWVDQAILYTQLGSEEIKDDTPTRRQRLREHGIRNGSALIEAWRNAGAGGLNAIFPSSGPAPMESLVHTIVVNPNLRLVMNWRGLTPP